jgi:hypothetical protein
MTKFHGWAELGEFPLHLGYGETIIAKGFVKGPCKVLISHEMHAKKLRYHLSISCERRYPVWEEIKDARYALLPVGLWFAQLLPPSTEYTNVHPHCFHLWEIENADW